MSSEIFQKQINHALDGLDGIVNIADDILVFNVGETEEDAEKDHDTKLTNLLHRCKERGIALNPDKLKLRIPTSGREADCLCKSRPYRDRGMIRHDHCCY